MMFVCLDIRYEIHLHTQCLRYHLPLRPERMQAHHLVAGSGLPDVYTIFLAIVGVLVLICLAGPGHSLVKERRKNTNMT